MPYVFGKRIPGQIFLRHDPVKPEKTFSLKSFITKHLNDEKSFTNYFLRGVCLYEYNPNGHCTTFK